MDKVLKSFGMEDSKKGFLPMLPNTTLSKNQSHATPEDRERMSKTPYVMVLPTSTPWRGPHSACLETWGKADG